MRAIDTALGSCAAAVYDAGLGETLAAESIDMERGHAEAIMPMVERVVRSSRVDFEDMERVVTTVGPGSFTGLRVAIAAAHGMAIGWSIPLTGMNSLALLAASAPPGDGKVAAAMTGGHGELFVQTFDRKKLTATGPILNLSPPAAAMKVDAPLVVGSGAPALVAARHSGEALELLPSASRALALPELLRTLDCKPIYARAPDAKIPAQLVSAA